MNQALLFVDDNPVNRQLLNNMLKPKYAQVLEADNGKSCLEILEQHPIDLLLLDLNMPEISGFEVLERIKAAKHGHPPTVIVVSSDKDPAIISKAFHAGAADYVTTPYHREELLARINTHLVLRDREIQLEELVSQRSEQLTKTNEQLQQAQKQLIHADKMASLGQLAAGVAHEINNPIGFIRSNLHSLQDYLTDVNEFIAVAKQSLKQQGDTPQSLVALALYNKLDLEFITLDIKQLMIDSLQGTDQIKQIVTDLKGYSYPQEQLWKEIDIHEVIETSLNIVANQLKYKIRLEKVFEQGLPQVSCIHTQITQVLVNLLVNAEQAIDTRGFITVTTRLNQSNKSQHYVEISIADTGAGIAPELQDKIFDPFYTTKPIDQGNGLGLSISYNIASGHNGHIAVSSELEQGAEFTLSLPV